MAGDIELGKHANAAIMRVGEKVADFGLGVVHAVGAYLGELVELLAFDAKPLVVREMPVQDVHLHGGHTIEVAFEHIEGNEVAADVDEQAAPREAGLVLYGDGGGGESGRSDLDELQKCLQAAQDAKRSPGGELSLIHI